MDTWTTMLDLAGKDKDAYVPLDKAWPAHVQNMAQLKRAVQLENPRTQLSYPGPLADPGNWMFIPMESTKKSDWYSKQAMEDYVQAAKRHGVDPLVYTALGMSESHLGNLNPSNPSMIYPSAHNASFQRQYGKGIGEVPLQSVDYGARVLRNAFSRFPNDLLSAIQAYSGTGRTIYKNSPWVSVTPNTKYFGRPIKDIDFWAEKPQARRVLSIMEELQKNREFMDYFNSLITPETIPE